mgnify:FL=1
MARMYSEDAYCLGLLYVYQYSNTVQKMVLLDDLKNFHNCIESNLEEKGNKDYLNFWNDNDEQIYFASSNKNGEIYYILDPMFDYSRAQSLYIGILPVDVLIASQKENALNTLGLEKVNGVIRIKSNQKQVNNDKVLKKRKNFR